MTKQIDAFSTPGAANAEIERLRAALTQIVTPGNGIAAMKRAAYEALSDSPQPEVEPTCRDPELSAIEQRLGIAHDPYSSRPRYLFILDAIDLLRQSAMKSSEKVLNADGSPHVCSFNEDGRCVMHPFTQRT